MNWADFLHADCDAIIFDQAIITLFIFDTVKCQSTIYCQSKSTVVVLVSPLAVAGRILWNRKCLSFPPYICQRVFLEFDHEIALNFAMVLKILMKLCMTARFFGKTVLHWKLGNRQKIVFFNLKKKIGHNFHWICSIMKLCIICCISAQILYLGKILFLRFRPKCCQSIRLRGF